MMGGDFGWGWMPLGGLMMVLVWGGAIAVVVLVVQSLTRERTAAGPGSPYELHREDEPTALELLDRRYAKGELSRDEYMRMRQDLQGEKPR